jgi:hypothetical protein
MNIPEAHIGVTDEMPSLYFRRNVKPVYLQAKYRPTDKKFADKQNYI